MKKFVPAVALGLVLVAGQAIAAGQATSARVGDRVGAQSEASSEFAGIPLIGLIAVAGIIAATVGVASDDSDSD